MAGEGEGGREDFPLPDVLADHIKQLNLGERERGHLTKLVTDRFHQPFRATEVLQNITDSHLVDASVKWLTRAAVHVGVPFGAAYGLAAAFPTAAGTDFGLAAGLTLAILALEKNKRVSEFSSWVGDRAGDAMRGLTTRLHGMEVKHRINQLTERFLPQVPAVMK